MEVQRGRRSGGAKEGGNEGTRERNTYCVTSYEYVHNVPGIKEYFKQAYIYTSSGELIYHGIYVRKTCHIG